MKGQQKMILPPFPQSDDMMSDDFDENEIIDIFTENEIINDSNDVIPSIYNKLHSQLDMNDEDVNNAETSSFDVQQLSNDLNEILKNYVFRDWSTNQTYYFTMAINQWQKKLQTMTVTTDLVPLFQDVQKVAKKLLTSQFNAAVYDCLVVQIVRLLWPIIFTHQTYLNTNNEDYCINVSPMIEDLSVLSKAASSKYINAKVTYNEIQLPH